MSTEYKLEKEILMRDLFDGRLGEFGVWKERWDESVDGFGILTDGINQIGVYGNRYVESLKRCGANQEHKILYAIHVAFDTEIYSEYSPQFWGYETDDEWLAAEADQHSDSAHPNSKQCDEYCSAIPENHWGHELKVERRLDSNQPITNRADKDLIVRILRRSDPSNYDQSISSADKPRAASRSDTPTRGETVFYGTSDLERDQRWFEFKREEIIDHTGCDHDAAEIVIQLATEERLLPDYFTLYFKDHGRVSVAELLSNPTKFDSCYLADPMTADFLDFPYVFEWNDGDPLVRDTYGKRYSYGFNENQVNKAILMYGLSILYSEEGHEFAPRAMKAAVDLLLGGYK